MPDVTKKIDATITVSVNHVGCIDFHRCCKYYDDEYCYCWLFGITLVKYQRCLQCVETFGLGDKDGKDN